MCCPPPRLAGTAVGDRWTIIREVLMPEALPDIVAGVTVTLVVLIVMVYGIQWLGDRLVARLDHRA